MSNKLVNPRPRRQSDTDTNPHSIKGMVSSKDMGSGLAKPKSRVEKWHKSTATEEESTLDKLSVLIHEIIPDSPSDVIYGATEAVAEICTSSADTKTKLQQTIDLLGEPVSDTVFGEIVRLSKQLGDEWGAHDTVAENSDFVFTVDDDDEEEEEEGDYLHASQDQTVADISKFNSRTNVNQQGISTQLTIPMNTITPLTIHQLVSEEIDVADVPQYVAKIEKLISLNNDEFNAELLDSFEYEHLDLINKLVHNRERIYWKLQYLDNAEDTLAKLSDRPELARELQAKRPLDDDSEVPLKRQKGEESKDTGYQLVDIPQYAAHGDIQKPKVNLPKGTFQETHHDYDMISVPPPSMQEADTSSLIQIQSLPEYCHTAFGNAHSLNRIQSAVFSDAFKSDANMLICAPTGAGKTNIAMLTILQVLGKYLDQKTPKFKAVYIAPLKALVQEQVRAFESRLPNLVVREVTGDSDTTTREISEANILVVTPEKWDVITRKSPQYVKQVELLIIDEIHLLHDDRGPVLESLIVRTRRDANVRIVGLSATLPNYQDVAKFIGATAVHYFDGSFRPCPLEQKFYGVKGRGVKRVAAMNEIVQKVCSENLGNSNQVIVFVHSRKETGKLAKHLGEVVEGVVESAGVQSELDNAVNQYQNQALKEAVRLGVGCHHAGLSVGERQSVEKLFYDGKLKILVSTATLAWGVNLPAHAVVIRGTESYSAKEGTWKQLSPQDILQMLGRAGRPGFDTSGEGTVITGRDWLQYYLAVTNQQLPIESSLPEHLPSAMNAEVVSGIITDFQSARTWLDSTYYAIRVNGSPSTYGMEDVEKTLDDITHSALTQLADGQLVIYDVSLGTVTMTELGKIASYFYLSPATIATYLHMLKPWYTEIDLLSVFSHSDEFSQVAVRSEEKYETKKLYEKCPIPIKEDPTSGTAKIAVLLQSYLSRLNLQGFALNADMVYVSQSGSRLFAALAQICMIQGWAQLAQLCSRFALMVQHRLWYVDTPFRQLEGASSEVIRATQAASLPLESYIHQQQLEQFQPQVRDQLARLVRRFPILSIDCEVQTIAPSVIRLQVDIQSTVPHRFSVMVVVENTIIWSDSVQISHTFLDLFLPLMSPQPQAYHVIAVSQKWLHCEYRRAVVTTNLKPPKRFPGATPINVDQMVVPVTKLKMDVEWGFPNFNSFVSQVFPSVWDKNANVYVGMAKGNGRTTVGMLAICRWLVKSDTEEIPDDGKVLWLSPRAMPRLEQLQKRLKSLPVEVGILTGDDFKQDMITISQSHVIIASPVVFEELSRKWTSRKLLHRFDLVVAQDIQAMMRCWQYESSIIRLGFISKSLNRPQRKVVVGNYVGNGEDIGKEWIGCDKQDVYNFSGADRVVPCSIQLVVDDQTKVVAASEVVYCGSRQQCLEVARAGDFAFTNINLDNLILKSPDPQVVKLLKHGVGILYQGMDPVLERKIRKLHTLNKLSVVIATGDCIIDQADSITVWDTSIPVTQLLDLVGSATTNAVVYVPANQIEQYEKFISYKTPLPLESNLRDFLDDALFTEIMTGTVDTMQECVNWLSYTYFYRRFQVNPSYYDAIISTSPDGVSEYVSDLIETSVQNMSIAQIVELEEFDDGSDKFGKTTEGIIASRYSVSVYTMTQWVTGPNKLSERTRLKGMLWALSQASELAVEGEDYLELEKVAPIKVDEATPAFYLLQAYFSRVKVKPEMYAALQHVVEAALPLVNAMVNLLSSQGYLNAMVAMELSQMLVQAMWKNDSPLVQLPHVSAGLLDRASKLDPPVSTIFDIFALEDDDRVKMLGMDEESTEFSDVANFCNSYPNIDLRVSVGEVSTTVFDINVILERDIDEDDDADGSVISPLRREKYESWWVVVGDFDSKQLYAIKQTNILQSELVIKMSVEVPTPGSHNLSVWAICDSYAEADKEVMFTVDVA